jgi:hypothetical protein
MINNFDKIYDLMIPSLADDHFYFVQILKRRKDNPGMKKDMIVIENISIWNRQDYADKFNRIREACDKNNARAYFRLNIRNLEKTAMLTMVKTAKYIQEGNFKAVKGAFWSAAGEINSEPVKRWIVDIDVNSPLYVGEVISYITELQKDFPLYVVETVIPTANGYHIITNPFNVQEFKKIYPDVDIHKDNPTLLYVP